jgi:hypothetical protein
MRPRLGARSVETTDSRSQESQMPRDVVERTVPDGPGQSPTSEVTEMFSIATAHLVARIVRQDPSQVRDRAEQRRRK